MLTLVMAAIGGASRMLFSATLDKSSTSGNVTSDTIIVTVPGGNSGVLTFSSYSDTGTILSTQYSQNGGAFTTIADGADTAAFSNGDSLAVKTNGVGLGEARTFTVTDKTTGQVIGTYTHDYG